MKLQTRGFISGTKLIPEKAARSHVCISSAAKHPHLLAEPVTNLVASWHERSALPLLLQAENRVGLGGYEGEEQTDLGVEHKNLSVPMT